MKCVSFTRIRGAVTGEGAPVNWTPKRLKVALCWNKRNFTVQDNIGKNKEIAFRNFYIFNPNNK